MATGILERTTETKRPPDLLARLRRATWQGQRIDWSAYLFILPFFVAFLVFLVAPIVLGGYVSMTQWGIVGDPEWIGLDNFTRALSDPWVPKIWFNTLKYGLIVVPSVTIVGLLCALFVNQRQPGHTFARIAFYAPNVVSVTVIGLVWVWMLDTQFGLVNQYLGGLGIPNIPWLTNPAWVLFGIGMAAIWWEVGFSMVILLAGLQEIPRELREAAAVDGANRWTTFWRIVLPLLRPALSLVLTIQIIATLRVFSLMYVMTNGGPAGASASVISYVYEMGFSKYQLGYAAALSMMLFVTIVVVTIVELKIVRASQD
jgi:multiple sugar transport system permease protein